jgi:hypothetical protein
VATFALGQDNAFGQPLESQLRSCLLATALCEEAGFDGELRDTVYWVALLRYLGCTGHAHEIATVFGDDIAVLAETLVFDAADPADVMRAMVKFATAGRAPEEHEQIVASLRAGAHDWAVHNFATGCEVADMLVQRLGLEPGVREALAFTYERWNGNGFPTGARGDEIPLAMRVVHLTQDMEAIARRVSPDEAIRAARERRDRTYDPELADLFEAHGGTWFDALGKMDPWDAVLDREPEPHRVLEGAELDEALTVAADFIDLKSPNRAGHSRRCAHLAADAARLLGASDAEITAIRRAGLLHEFGTTAVRTRSGTSADRSRARSSIASSCTRCSPSRCSAARPPSPPWARSRRHTTRRRTDPATTGDSTATQPSSRPASCAPRTSTSG